MASLPFANCTIHLDFHTSPAIGDVGRDFDADAHVDSVTIFAKCHHGHLYYATERAERHPGLPGELDLMGEQIEALHRRGIQTSVYLSVQLEEYAANLHPEWLAIDAEGPPVKRGASPFEADWQVLDMDSPYADYFADQLDEVLRRYEPCEDCGVRVGADDRCTCEPCDRTFCSECMDRCPHCEDTICHGCMSRCHACDEPVCEGCTTRCGRCRRHACPNCMATERCASCREEEREAYEDEPQHHAKDPLGVGRQGFVQCLACRLGWNVHLSNAGRLNRLLLKRSDLGRQGWLAPAAAPRGKPCSDTSSQERIGRRGS